MDSCLMEETNTSKQQVNQYIRNWQSWVEDKERLSVIICANINGFSVQCPIMHWTIIIKMCCLSEANLKVIWGLAVLELGHRISDEHTDMN